MSLKEEQSNPTEPTEKTVFELFQVILKKAKKKYGARYFPFFKAKSSTEYAICKIITKLSENCWINVDNT